MFLSLLVYTGHCIFFFYLQLVETYVTEYFFFGTPLYGMEVFQNEGCIVMDFEVVTVIVQSSSIVADGG